MFFHYAFPFPASRNFHLIHLHGAQGCVFCTIVLDAEVLQSFPVCLQNPMWYLFASLYWTLCLHLCPEGLDEIIGRVIPCSCTHSFRDSRMRGVRLLPCIRGPELG